MTLEELLNKLIEKGWKPRGIYNLKEIKYDERGFVFVQNLEEDGTIFYNSLRDLVSLESGLWQFLCDRKLHIYHKPKFYYDPNIQIKEGDRCNYIYEAYCYQYRLMLLSIQTDIKNFLLDNIKIDD